MPEDEPIALEDQSDATPAPAARSPILAKIKILLFVVAVVGGECLVAYLCVPSESQTAAMAGAVLGGNVPSEPPPAEEPAPEEEEEAADQVEVDLEEYDVTSFQPASNTTLRISFHLWGTVALKDEDRLYELLQGNKNRLREQILVTIRSADVTDLTEPGLGLVKRRILEKANQTLGEPLLRTIIFSDFSSIEQ
ncbi:MAG: hypothetical protein A2V70_11900 [Planctomycetes bacterium RBG_13_63_9]|nr:MAG: hypothetical protein A2V70_11900 [Planctomycetes bacterium RBG_13_63_9]